LTVQGEGDGERGVGKEKGEERDREDGKEGMDKGSLMR
jgi:hypothetical protein